MANVDPPSRVSIVARRLRVQQSGKVTLPASQKLKNIKSPCIKGLKRFVGTLPALLILLISKNGQGSRPGNGHQSHTQLKTTNTTGKYHRPNSNQSSWSRPQYIRNCASGANDTPLGSPRRMSPVETSAVKPSPSAANAATETERGDVKKRDAEVCLYALETIETDSRLRRNTRRMERNQKRRGGRRNMTLLENMTGKTHDHHEMKRTMRPPR
jgi:hypothetical protein